MSRITLVTGIDSDKKHSVLMRECKNKSLVLYPEERLYGSEQLKKADELIGLSESVELVINTHSEHIVNRLVRRVLDGTLQPEETKIIYVKGEVETVVEITKCGIVNWGDFHEHTGKEQWKILELISKNKKER